MSLQRAVAPLTSSAPIIFRFASSQSSTPLRECRQIFRQFSSSRVAGAAAKRKMQTSTWQTYTLSPLPPPPPPLEAAIPETSINGSIPQVHDTRPPSISVADAETQTTKPVKKRPRYNFVPLKKTISLTPRAVEALRELSNQPEAKLIKISVANRGCSGSAYDLKYVEKGALSDIVHEQDGVKVLIDPTAQLKIIGSTMDWVEDRLSAKFVFDNPNIDKSCGCGESFMTKDESAAREAEKKASKSF
ncbi:Iron-sulfur assembly protein 1 [Ciborinia camelliae]|nr:Iron-sulfur assembly protein 1 [Ciborinia camelliae]